MENTDHKKMLQDYLDDKRKLSSKLNAEKARQARITKKQLTEPLTEAKPPIREAKPPIRETMEEILNKEDNDDTEVIYKANKVVPSKRKIIYYDDQETDSEYEYVKVPKTKPKPEPTNEDKTLQSKIDHVKTKLINWN
jgi:hypothetical protein